MCRASHCQGIRTGTAGAGSGRRNPAHGRTAHIVVAVTTGYGMTDKAWYLVQTKPAQERLAAGHLERQGFCTFLPLMTRQVRRGGRWHQRIEPLFPRYLFVQLAAAGEDWAPIRSTVGVTCLVRFGSTPAVVPEDVVTALRARADADGVVVFDSSREIHKGQRVRIMEGPLAGLEGVVTAKNSRERVDILLAVVGQGAVARMSSQHVAPA